jgi:hypothetical protein
VLRLFPIYSLAKTLLLLTGEDRGEGNIAVGHGGFAELKKRQFGTQWLIA